MNRRKIIELVLIICFGLVLTIAGCNTPKPTTQPTSSTPPELNFPAGSYDSVQTYSNSLTLAYTIKGDVIAIGLKARSAGWIGFALGNAHGTSDVIMCFVVNDQLTVQDCHDASKAGVHPLDTSNGGTDDVTVVGGSELNGITTIEFTRKLVTGDTLDLAFVKGNNTITWALGPTDAITSHHSQIGFATIFVP
jgi:hypothetical protein